MRIIIRIAASAAFAGIMGLSSFSTAAAMTPDPPSEAFTAMGHPVVSIWQDGTNRQVWSYAKADGDVYACGKFSSFDTLAGNTVNRASVYSVTPTSASTGYLTDFAPVVKNGNGSESAHEGTVNKCVVSSDGAWLYLFGSFNLVDGIAVGNMARVNIITMTVNGVQHEPGTYATPFGSANGAVTDGELGHGHVFVYGSFTAVDGHAQTGIATLNLDGSFSSYFRSKLTGQISPTAGSTKSFRGAVSPNQKLMAGTINATAVDGQPRQQIALWGLHKHHAVLLKWEPAKARYPGCRHGKEYQVLHALQFQGNGKLFTGSTGGSCRRGLNDATIKFDVRKRGLHLRPDWSNRTLGDTIWGMVIHKGVVCVSGHMKQTETAPGTGIKSDHNGIVCLNAADGHVLDWRSDQPRCVGGKVLFVAYGYLFAGTDCGDGMYVRLWS